MPHDARTLTDRAWSVHTREILYSFLSGIFLTSLTLGNVVGITKFVDLGWFVIPAGLLAYPFTFLATDLISELYGPAPGAVYRLGWFLHEFLHAFSDVVWSRVAGCLGRIRGNRNV